MSVMQSNGLLDVGGQLPVSAAVVVDSTDPLPELHLGQDVVDGSLAVRVAGEDSLISLLAEGLSLQEMAGSKDVLLELLAHMHNLRKVLVDGVAVLEFL